MLSALRRILGGALLLVGLAAGSASAGSLSVAPTTVKLDAKGGAAVLYAMNRGDQPIMVQVEGYAWVQRGGTDRLIATDALQLSPPMARIAPGEKQTIRLRVTPSTQPHERSFRLLVSELPDPNHKTSDGVRVLLQFSVPVFVDDRAHEAPALHWEAQRTPDGIRVSVRNRGAGYAKLVDLTAVAPDGSRHPLTAKSLNYVLAGAERSWTLSHLPHAPAQLRIEGRELHGNTALHAAVTVRD
ncbi:fimbrial biogenesis chaperone [Oleiagrimonas soli]|uniref:Fimbrial chaperone protein n=1 Tax=Oleiagrimonas soli TaxID=1543381 RepID=A0A841KP37_9GAMM|nr:fimbria/pilus periplasmic chaperone [Oleiagrimonas soli]MBB6185609.1 fimbrial chaperone protein [Oleiagrimonas soli]